MGDSTGTSISAWVFYAPRYLIVSSEMEVLYASLCLYTTATCPQSNTSGSKCASQARSINLMSKNSVDLSLGKLFVDSTAENNTQLTDRRRAGAWTRAEDSCISYNRHLAKHRRDEFIH